MNKTRWSHPDRVRRNKEKAPSDNSTASVSAIALLTALEQESIKSSQDIKQKPDQGLPTLPKDYPNKES